MTYPRVLIVALGRINAADTANNGLLLRNLFAGWPKENLAQIYSSGDNGEEGFFGHYYRLGPRDRRLGHVFYRLKSLVEEGSATGRSQTACATAMFGRATSIKGRLKRLLVETGLYELVFSPRVSREMLRWVKDFRPDVIFAQGYCLTFVWLPVMLKEATRAQLAFLAADDWPTYLYSGQLGEPRVFARILRPIVEKATRQLMSVVDVPFAFGQPMADEYGIRYKKPFITISHSDDPRRFGDAIPLRSHPPGVTTVLAMGIFHRYRWPLLLDANECCRLLNEQGILARIVVLSSSIAPEAAPELSQASYIDFTRDPGNALLPRYLKGADILLLADGFDKGFVSAIRLSVSSKSHLFMMSRRPIIVYAHPDSGVSKYASAYHWAQTVGKRDARALVSAIRDIREDQNKSSMLISHAVETYQRFHLREVNQTRFLESLAVPCNCRG
jgi:hypothetical protein